MCAVTYALFFLFLYLPVTLALFFFKAKLKKIIVIELTTDAELFVSSQGESWEDFDTVYTEESCCLTGSCRLPWGHHALELSA